MPRGAFNVSDAEATRALKQIGKKIHGPNPDGYRAGGGWVAPSPTCQLVPFGGRGYGMHHICNRTAYILPCVTLTYGVQNEWTFESDVRRRIGCRVFALDPTVNHKAELEDGLFFLKWAAPSPAGIDPFAITGGDNSQSGWFFMPPPLLAKLVAPGNTPIPVLKMDCEGCEYALYDSVMQHDPSFFTRVDQFAVEVHLSKTIGATDRRRVLNYGRLLGLLHKSGHQLQHSLVAHCSEPDKLPESLGVVRLFTATGYHRTSTEFGTDGHCHNYLFARVSSSMVLARV